MRVRVSPAVAGATGTALRFVLAAAPGLLAAAAITYGVGQVYEPAGWITGGALVLSDVVWTRTAPARATRSTSRAHSPRGRGDQS